MKEGKILIVGGGIGGLTAAIALRQKGFEVDLVERDPSWSVYGVGIIQQSNVVRAVAQLGILDDYLEAGFGFDHVEVYLPDGRQVAKIPAPKLAEGYPANIGIGRPALHKVLGDRAKASGAAIRLGVTSDSLKDDGAGVDVVFSDGSAGRYDLVIGADGLYSATRRAIMPDAPTPQPTGQSVWRYNFVRPDDVTCLCAYEGPMGIGLVPLSADRMYMFATTPETPGRRFEREGLAAEMRARLRNAPPRISELTAKITDDEDVVYKPLECLFVDGPWHRGRVVLLGDAVHATTPHLGQGAGMAIEDSLVLADELTKADTPEQAFEAYHARRFERCRYIVERSRAIGDAQLGKGPPADTAGESRKMFEITAQPI